jgi:E3 ubiquitin-protein ligase RNF13
MMKSTRGAMLFPLCLCAVVWLMAQIGAANVVLMGNNLTLSFDDVEATFGKFWISILPSSSSDRVK